VKKLKDTDHKINDQK